MAVPFYNQGDQNIYAGGEHFIPQEKYRLNYTPSTALASTIGNTGGVTNTSAAYPYYAQGGGGGGSFNARQLIPDFYSATANRQKSLENPGWLQQQINKYTGGGQRPVSEMISPQDLNYSRSINKGMTSFGLDQPIGADYKFVGEGAFGNMPGVIEGDVRKTAGLPFGIGSMISKIMPDKYYDMDPASQAYIQSQMGYSGPTIFGENTMGNKDPFGRNVRSAFGDYGAAQQKSIDKMKTRLGSDEFIGKYGNLSLEQDEDGNWRYVGGPGAAEANRRNKLNLQRYNFDKRGIHKLNLIKQNVATQRKMRDAWEAETGREMDQADINFADTGDYDEYAGAGGTPNYNIPAPTYSYEGSDEQDKANEGSSFGGGNEPHGTDTSGDFAGKGSGNPFGHAQGGRIGYRDAGPVGIEELLEGLSQEEIEELLRSMSGNAQGAPAEGIASIV